MCSYGQGLIRAASGTTLGVLGASKWSKMGDGTDVRILGGSRKRGGGVDARLRIKLPPRGRRAVPMMQQAALGCVECVLWQVLLGGEVSK